MQKKRENELKVKSLQKAIEILNCFTEKSTWGVTELSEYLDLNKSNVHSILTTFKAMEYLDQDEETGKYKLGLGIYTLSHALGENNVISNIALPYMQELADRFGERVYLGIPHEDEVVYVSSTYPQEAVYLMRTIIGERAKMYCTGLGKAMMAYLPEDRVRQYAREEKERYTEYTITEENALLEIVRLVGRDSLSEQDQLKLETAKSLREDFLQQNAYHEVDTYCSLRKQIKMLKLIITFHEKALEALDNGVYISEIENMPIREDIARAKYIPETEMDKIDTLMEKISTDMKKLAKDGGAVNA